MLGHQVRKQNFSTATAAEEFYHSARKQIREGTWIKSSVNLMASMKMDELYQHFCRRKGHRRAEATIYNGLQNWRLNISPYLGMKTARQITKRTLAVWTDALRDKGLSDNSIKVVRAELSNVLKMAYEYDLIDGLPVFSKLSPRPKRKELFSPDEIKELLGGFKDEQYRLMALVQFQLALRVGELLGLRPAAFDLDNQCVRIDRQAARLTKGLPWKDRLRKTKNSVSRTLPISADLVELIRPLVESRPDEGPLWVSSYGNPASETAYNSAIKTAAKRAGLTRKVSSHCLRASMLNWLVNESGMNIQSVAWFGRHDPKVLLQVYSAPNADQVFQFFTGNDAPNSALTCDFLALEETEGL